MIKIMLSVIDINKNKRRVDVKRSGLFTNLYNQHGEEYEVQINYEIELWDCLESGNYGQYNIQTIINAANFANFIQHDCLDSICTFICDKIPQTPEQLANILNIPFNPQVDEQLITRYSVDDLKKLN